MRLLVNGVEGLNLPVAKGGDTDLLQLEVVGSNGELVDVTALACKLEIYQRADRTGNSPIEVSLSPDSTNPTCGRLTAQKILAATTTQLPVGLNYAFSKIGSGPIFCQHPLILNVG